VPGLVADLIGRKVDMIVSRAGRILNGAEPAGLAVEQPIRFELVVNLKTAETLGPIPRSVLASVGGSSNECARQAGAIQPVEDRPE